MKANILLEGDIGTGKTTSLRTLLPIYIDETGMEHRGAGLQLFVVSLDPGLKDSFGTNLCDGGEGCERKAHWHYIAPRPLDSVAAEQWVRFINQMSSDQLQKMVDPKRSEYDQFIKLYALCNNFVCQGCTKSFGSIYKMGEDCAVALDTLTGLTTIAKTNHVGGRPLITNPEIGTIHNTIETFMDLWWGSTSCSAILIGHIEREINPLTGASYIALSTLGNKLSPKLEKKPDDIILAVKDNAGKFWWDTAEKGMSLKGRHLPLANNLPADFTQIFVKEGRK